MKVKHIEYGKGELRKNIFWAQNSSMKWWAYNIRCQSFNEFRDIFHQMHGQAPIYKHCDLNIDSQELSL